MHWHRNLNKNESITVCRRIALGLTALLFWVGCPQKDPQDLFRFGVDQSLAELKLGEYLKVAFETHEKKRVRLVYGSSSDLAQAALAGELDSLLLESESSIASFEAEGIPIRVAPFAHEEFIFIGPFKDYVGRYREGSGHEVLAAIARTNFRYLRARKGSAERTRHEELFKATRDRVEPTSFMESPLSGLELVNAALDDQSFALVKRSSLLLARSQGRVVHRIYKAGDSELVLRLVAVEVHPAKTKRPRRPELFDFLMGTEGQKLIEDFGREQFGVPVFVRGAPEEGKGAEVPLPKDWERPPAPVLLGGAKLE